ncbi:MAG: NAD(P)-dependent alcohol dehydrogenase [Bacteroidetes bacterium]|nr:MAG: NAD(P)-dependent alcohol dehydrogenase [Bacteroidota bacterium]
MKAVFTTKYGPPEVLIIVEVDKPLPKKNELLIKIKAVAVTSGDCRMRSFNVPLSLWLPARLSIGLTKPRNPIQGLWLAGEVEETGAAVSKFKVGQQIYGRTLDLKLGANAEYICLPENCILGLKPQNLTYEESVSLPFGGITALYFLRKTNIKKGDKVLIYGASGSVGISAVQLGKYFGAEIHAVCSNENIELVKKYGADKAIDYKKENINDIKDKFDVVFDAVGKINKSISKKLLKEKGNYISILTSGHAQGGRDELIYLTELAEKNFLKPVIDKCYPFEQIVEAHRYVDKGHKKGNVVISLNNE